MDKGKHAQRHKERTHRWTKENMHKDIRRELTDGQGREREHTHTHTYTNKQKCP
jgi:hypothetical protein